MKIRKILLTTSVLSMTFIPFMINSGSAYGQSDEATLEAFDGLSPDEAEELRMAIELSKAQPTSAEPTSPRSSVSSESNMSNEEAPLNEEQESLLMNIYLASIFKINPEAAATGDLNGDKVDPAKLLPTMLEVAHELGADEAIQKLLLGKYQEYLAYGGGDSDSDIESETGSLRGEEEEDDGVIGSVNPFIPKAIVKKSVGGGLNFAPLRNHGNTCYINASIKALAANEDFIKFLSAPKKILNKMSKSKDKKLAKEGKLKRDLAIKLKKLLLAVRRDQSKITDPVKRAAHEREIIKLQRDVMKKFLLALGASGDSFNGERRPRIPGGQYDSPEFIAKLLDYVQYPSKQGIRLPSLIKRDGEPAKFNHQTVAESMVAAETFQYDEYGRVKGFGSVQAVIDNFLKNERVEDAKLDKKMVFLDSRNSMMVQLKRTAFDMETGEPVKVSTPLEVGEVNIPVYGQDMKIKETATYAPSAVVVQVGGAGAGHYYTYVKDSANQWVLHDDAAKPRVELSAEEDIKRNGYVVLYKLVKKKKAE